MIEKEKAKASLPLHERAERSMKRAVAKAIEQHRRAGIPLSILRDGKVVEVSAEELLANGAEKPHAGNGTTSHGE